MEYQEQIDYNNIIDTLIYTFGEVLSRDVINNIVETFNGDLQESANAIMNIVMDENNAAVTDTPPDLSLHTFEQEVAESNQTETYDTSSDQNNETVETVSEVAACMLPALSYASASQLTKPQNGQKDNDQKASTTLDMSQNFWTEQLQKILLHHENGTRTLIIMRGLPGSGKTYLAKKIIDAIYNTRNQHYLSHILRTDDYFMRNGVYMYDKSRLSEAHEWNQNRARIAMKEGLSPVIIDNTNIEIWEMEHYVVQGVKNGYVIEVVEPNTPWARNANQLFRKNSHNVPMISIRKKLDNFQSGISGEYLIQQLKLKYPASNMPPVARKIPAITLKSTEESINSDSHTENASSINEINSIKEMQENHHENIQSCSTESKIATTATEDPSDTEDYSGKPSHLSINLDKFAEIQQCLEKMEEVEKEWDNGEHWEDNNSKAENQDSENCDPINSKPQRRNKNIRSGSPEKFLNSDEVSQDWSKCFMFLPSWGESSTQVESSIPVVEKRTSSTCVEYGDTDISSSKNPLKIITSVPRNINEYHIAVNEKKIPEKWMLDKSTSTNNNLLTDTFRCQNEEQHFSTFRKLFRNIPKSDLRDIFDKCHGDVNWAVDIVLDGAAYNRSDIVDTNDDSDTEAEEQNDNADLCQCLSAYDIIPNHNESSSLPVIQENENSLTNVPSCSKSKCKKENFISENVMLLKRQIEQNVVISDNHYSEHCLKIRKLRRGEYYNDNVEKTINEQGNTKTSEVHATENNVTSPNSQQSPNHSSTPSTSKIESADSETYDEDLFVYEDVEKTVNVTLGKEFISQLDEMFGRHNMVYPSSVVCKINMPVSLLNEINALWMESLMNQLEEDAKQSEIMLQQDEEFARQLATKEAEMIQSGKEPEVPDFKEIMDMDFALSLYHKDVAEWRKNMPDDLAAKLTRDKLYNLFPEVAQDILSELLVAHDNNFQQTVEALLISTGRSEILETKNGASKFVMEKEMEMQEKLLEEARQNALEAEWPLLPDVEVLDMSVVDFYRAEAEKHLKARTMNFNKAEAYIRRGITQVAAHYSEMARFHKTAYETANSRAAAVLMHIHASNTPNSATIDLHYLRVGEARETVDLFIDTHIQMLREGDNGVKSRPLFFITGRGRHSSGGPRIKPAVKKRLAERGLSFCERNPGLISAKVSFDDKLSYQVA